METGLFREDFGFSYKSIFSVVAVRDFREDFRSSYKTISHVAPMRRYFLTFSLVNSITLKVDVLSIKKVTGYRTTIFLRCRQ